VQTHDVHVVRYGTPGNGEQPLNFPMGAAPLTIYRGTIALVDNTGLLKSQASPLTTDSCWGLIDQVVPTRAIIDGGPGITGGSTAGAVTVDVLTGSFYLACGTGADAMTAANVGATVYVMDDITVGLTASTRPKAGILVGYDPSPPITALGPCIVKLNGAGVTGP
jgi:hypothetical protein